MKKTEEEEMLNGILRGDEIVLKQLYKKYLPAISKYVLDNSGRHADAEDIFQEALIVVYQKLTNKELKLTSTLKTYLFSICKNLWFKHLRRQQKFTNESSLLQIEADDDIIEKMQNTAKNQLYRKYFFRLGPKCQEIISFFVTGKSTDEIIEKTGYTAGYARKKKFECKKKLLEMIEKDPAFKEHSYPKYLNQND